MKTLAQARDTYLKIERSPTTNHMYGLVLANLVKAVGPARNVRRITFDDLADFLADYRSKHDLKPSSAKTQATVIRSFFSWCVRSGLIARNPAQDLRVRVPSHEDGPNDLRFIPPHDLVKVAEYTRLTSVQDYAFILFVADSGCRASAIASLTIDHLRLDEGEAVVLEKGNRWVVASFGEETAAALRAWLAERPAAKHLFVFTTKGITAKRVAAGGLAQRFKTLCKKAGCEREYSIHDARRAVGNAYAEHDVPELVTREVLHHKSYDTTLKHYTPRGRKVVKAWSKRIALLAMKPAPTPVEEHAPSKIIAFRDPAQNIG